MPEHAARVEQYELPHPPGLIDKVAHAHGKAFGQARLAQVAVPGVDIFHQQVHDEVLRLFAHVEVLQQEAAGAVAHIGEVVVAPGNAETQGLVEVLGAGEVLGGHQGLEFHAVEVAHRRSSLRSVQIVAFGGLDHLEEAVAQADIGHHAGADGGDGDQRVDEHCHRRVGAEFDSA